MCELEYDWLARIPRNTDMGPPDQNPNCVPLPRILVIPRELALSYTPVNSARFTLAGRHRS